ncbi:MAG TPA: hypothetical protein VIC26_00570 [Marinagarivorans sp.]
MGNNKPLLWATSRRAVHPAQGGGEYELMRPLFNRFFGIELAVMNDAGSAVLMRPVAKPGRAMQYGIFSDARHFNSLIIRVN